MQVNVGGDERVVRGVIGVGFLGVGLTVGRRRWWGLLLDVVGGLLLLSARTGFCHVKQTLGLPGVAEKG